MWAKREAHRQDSLAVLCGLGACSDVRLACGYRAWGCVGAVSTAEALVWSPWVWYRPQCPIQVLCNSAGNQPLGHIGKLRNSHKTPSTSPCPITQGHVKARIISSAPSNLWVGPWKWGWTGTNSVGSHDDLHEDIQESRPDRVWAWRQGGSRRSVLIVRPPLISSTEMNYIKLHRSSSFPSNPCNHVTCI